jgi:ATP-binding cassette subfamily F protein uup
LAKGGTDYTHLQKLTDEQERLEAELEQAVERWAELNELAEEIARNKGK